MVLSVLNFMNQKVFFSLCFFCCSGASLLASHVGERLYMQKCSHCHGLKGEQSVFETSAVIQGWQIDKTLQALHGYKDHSYGSTKKGVMKVIVARMDEKSIEDVATYIENLK